MQSALLLDVVVREGATVFQLLTCKDKTLLVRGNTLLVLDLGLDVVNGVRRLNLEGDRLSSERLDKDLHTSAQTKHKVKSALLLDVVVRKGATIFQLLTGKDKTLLVRGDALLVLNLGLDIVNRVRGLDFQCDGLSCECLDKDLHTTTESENEV